MEKPTCQEAQRKLEEIKTMKDRFNLALEKLQQGVMNIREVEEMKKKIVERANELREMTDLTIGRNFAKAREIMDTNERMYMGLEEINKTFTVDGKVFDESEIPPIPFTEEELKRAKELGQMLVLEIDKLPDGTPLTMKKINELLKERFKDEKKGKVLYDDNPWFKNEQFFTTETVPEKRWILKTKEIIREPKSVSKNYVEQTQLLVDYLHDKVYTDQKLPIEIAEAIKEYEQYYQKEFADKTSDQIKQLLRADWKKYTQELSELKINQLFRETPISAMQTTNLYLDNTEHNQRRLENTYSWTSARSSGGGLVDFGYADSAGDHVGSWLPADADDNLGVVFVRSSFKK